MTLHSNVPIIGLEVIHIDTVKMLSHMKEDGVRIESDCLCGKYRELCDLVGYAAVEKIYLTYGGGYISLPKKLLVDEFVHRYIVDSYKRGRKPKEIAKDYDYTYSWILKILRNDRLSQKN